MKKCKCCGKETNLLISLGGVLLCRDECYPDILDEVNTIRKSGREADITTIVHRRRQKELTRKRVARRNEVLNRKAKELGFSGLSEFLTKWKNDEIKIEVK